MTRFALDPAAEIKTQRQGREAEFVIIADNAAADVQSLVDYAASLSFGRIGPYYPGIRAATDAAFHQSAIDACGAIIDAHTGSAARTWKGDCCFSIVTTPPNGLLPIQRFPHFDGIEENRYAALLYLCGSDFGGTAFYRHKATGFETVGADRYAQFKTALESEVRRDGLPPAAYINDGAPFFEKIAEYDAAMNRMLIYRGKTFHCSRIARPDLLTPDPRHGRLTLNLFLTPGNARQ